MDERPAESVDRTLQRTAVERLLEWGFSHGDIAATLEHSEAWLSELQERAQYDQKASGFQPERSHHPVEE